jgi:hypothetical protein
LIAEYEQVARRDRIALRRFQHFLYRIRVGRSMTDWNHQAVPEAQQRSVVQDIILIVGKVKS